VQIYRFVVRSGQSDPRSAGCFNDLQALGFNNLQRIECQDLYFLEGQLQQDELQRLALDLLSDPVVQTATWNILPAPALDLAEDETLIEVALRPGVTDPVSGQIVRAAHQLGLEGVHRAATGTRYLLKFQSSMGNPSGGEYQRSQAEQIARQLLANPVIHHWRLGEIQPAFPIEAASSGKVEIIPIRSFSDAALLEISTQRRTALDLSEMKAIQAYFEEEDRDPSDVEIETIAQTWSEHCLHKTFKARIDVTPPTDSLKRPFVVDSLIRTHLKAATDQIAAPWVISAFVDNAGIIAFDEDFEVSFKVETHNHPSAIEPFGGANTGVGGVIRDVLGVSAKPIANTDILCFGPQDIPLKEIPEGVLHPRRIQSGVIAGVQDYGNKIGIPTVNGAILYDAGYTANPLVFCGCVGIASRGKHHKTPQAGDRVILLGGRTGRDGLRGATFSSMTMDAQTGEVSGASVQIGDPITEKSLIDVIVQARDEQLYSDITDCGAGGLSSAVGEMASRIGADIELIHVPLKYPGLAPWEIWLSEAQERMVLAVPANNIPALKELCDTFDTEMTEIGEITGSNRLIVRHSGQIVLDLANAFLHEGSPQQHLQASQPEVGVQSTEIKVSVPDNTPAFSAGMLLKLLAHPDIASKAATIRLYDHEIQGGTIIKPLTGIQNDGPSDAVVLKPIGTGGTGGIVISNGINPQFGKINPGWMAWAVVDEAIRNAVCVGAEPGRIALLDNFCWGDPKRADTLGALVEAVRGCHDAALHYGTPFISGKDSLNNEYLGTDGQRHSIPPTLLISVLGLIEDVNQAVSMDLKQAGNIIYLLGDFKPAMAGSHFSLVSGMISAGDIPAPSIIAPKVYRAFHQAIQGGLVASAHDLSEGGVAVCAAEMCIAGRLGMQLDIQGISLQPDPLLFGETNGCLLAEVSPKDAQSFEKFFSDLPIRQLGHTNPDGRLGISLDGGTQFSLSVEELVAAWNPVGEGSKE